SSITVTPLLSYLLFNPAEGPSENKDAYSGRVFQSYRKFLTMALNARGLVVIIAAVLFVASLLGFRMIDQSFFPPSTRPQFMVDTFLPSGVDIRETEAFASQVQQYIQAQPHVTHVPSFIGGGGLRFMLVYTPERENRAFVQFLVDVDDDKKIDGLVVGIQKYLDEKYPDAKAVTKKFLLGPGGGGRIQARFRGGDPAELRQLANQAEQILRDDGAIGV